ncbi:MAG: hypothetical protein V1827_02220, partial [Candidatus Micrarchaeota archaeon]
RKKLFQSVALSIACVATVGMAGYLYFRNAEPSEECINRLKTSAVCREDDGRVRLKDGNTLKEGDRVCYGARQIRIRRVAGKTYELGFVRDVILGPVPGSAYIVKEKDIEKVKIPKCE